MTIKSYETKRTNKEDSFNKIKNNLLIILVICSLIFLFFHYRSISGFIVAYNIEKSYHIKYPISLSSAYARYIDVDNLINKNNIKEDQQHTLFNKNMGHLLNNRYLSNIEKNISICLSSIYKCNMELPIEYQLSYMLFKIYNPSLHIIDINNKYRKSISLINVNNEKKIDEIENLLKSIQSQNHSYFYEAAISIISCNYKLGTESLNKILDNLLSYNLSNYSYSKLIQNLDLPLDVNSIINNNEDEKNKQFYYLIDIISRLIWIIEINSRIPKCSICNIKQDLVYYFDFITNNLI